MSSKTETMLLKHVIEDLNFTYDFWDFLRPHICKDFSGYGSSGEVHVFRFERRGSGAPHVYV